MQTIQSIVGVFGLLGLTYAISEDRREVSWRQAAIGLALTFVLAALFLKIPQLKVAFAAIGDGVDAIASATRAGTSFVFGYLGGGALPYELKTPGADFVFALQAPVVLVMSVLTTLMFHWGILPPIVRGFAVALNRTLGVGGAVGVSTAANIFLGMVEAPLCIKPYLGRLTRSEMFVVMTGGMAGIAGTVLVLYATVLGPFIPDAAGHLVVASVLGAPAAILISLIMVPERPETRAGSDMEKLAPVATSTMDAIVRGTTAGLELLLNIAAMLIVLIALVHLVNAILGQFPAVAGAPVTLERVLGIVMAPVCWLMGIPWREAVTAGALMGMKTILNEFVAYLRLVELPPDALSDRSRLIMVYALCGFANFGSLGIMIGGLSVMAPERRDDVMSLGFKSIVSGTLSTCLIGAIVGVLV